MLVLGRLLKNWVSIVVLLFLAGCSSTSLIKTYDGPQVEPSRSAVLSASGGIEVQSVNGKEVKKYLIPELDINYQLLPGVNTVVFTHESLWARPGKKEAGESNAELVVTKPMMISFEAKAGEVYQFDFDQPENRIDARNSVGNFKARLVNSSERVVAESSLYAEDEAPLVVEANSGAREAATVAASAVAATAVAGKVVPAEGAVMKSSNTSSGLASAAVVSQEAGLPTIDALKVLWDSASTEEKKAFLKWAFK